MAKIRLTDFSALQPGRPDLPAERPSDGVRTEAVFDGVRDPIHVRLHHLQAGDRIGWAGGATDYLGYVWEGAVVANFSAKTEKLGQGSMIGVEHGGAMEVSAERDGAKLLVFNRVADEAVHARAGGGAHLLPAQNVPRTEKLNDRANYGVALFADSACPTCEMWLHESFFHDANSEVAPHFHTEHEVIVVTGGEIVLGRRRYGRGAALAVARNTIYGFGTGAQGVSFINFRPSHPTYVTPGSSRIIDEQALYLGKLGRPQYLEV